MFTYVGSGTLSIGKCKIKCTYTPFFESEFSAGDTAYLKFRAEEGVLEKIVIRKVKFTNFQYKGNGIVEIIYFDTFNTAYNPEDLIIYNEALTITTAYLQRKAEEEVERCQL